MTPSTTVSAGHPSNVDTTSAEFFDRMYLREADPWNFAASPYEQARYQATLAALDHRRYTRAFEPGCSVGVLTERLAQICGTVEAIDISPAAVEQARGRCVTSGNVQIAVASISEYVPASGVDLIVLSEIGYYFSEAVIRDIVKSLLNGLQSGGTLLAVHWLGQSNDHILSGDRVHQILLSLPDLSHEFAIRNELPKPQAGYRLDRWCRT